MTKNLGLVIAFFGLDLKIYQKYPSRILFSFFQIFLVIFLFFYISEALGEIAFLKTKYFPFVASGLAFQHYFSGVVNAASEKLEEYRDYGVLEEILFSRYPPWVVMLSAGFQLIAISLIKSFVIFLVVAYAFQLKVNFILIGTCFILTFILALSLSFVASCSFLIWKRFSLLEIGGSLITLFLSGIYFPTNVLPKYLHQLAQLNPLMHSLDLFRAGLGIGSEPALYHEMTLSLTVILTSILLVIGLNFVLYSFCLKKVKQHGVSAHF